MPKIGPTHGVHPAAKARPKTNESGKLTTELEGSSFFSKFNFEIFVLNIIKIPNAMMIMPPTWLKFETNSFADVPKTEFIPTPIAENTTENPRTKNTVLNITFDLLMQTRFVVFDFFRSEIVVPEIYARKAGIIGKIQGAKNELIPANIARKMLTSMF